MGSLGEYIIMYEEVCIPNPNLTPLLAQARNRNAGEWDLHTQQAKLSH